MVDGRTFSVRYVEYQASDWCEDYEARLDLVDVAIRSQTRWEGQRVGDTCKRSKRREKHPPAGDGSRGNPILRLHVTWADLHPTGSR